MEEKKPQEVRQSESVIIDTNEPEPAKPVAKHSSCCSCGFIDILFIFSATLLISGSLLVFAISSAAVQAAFYSDDDYILNASFGFAAIGALTISLALFSAIYLYETICYYGKLKDDFHGCNALVSTLNSEALETGNHNTSLTKIGLDSSYRFPIFKQPSQWSKMQVPLICLSIAGGAIMIIGVMLIYRYQLMGSCFLFFGSLGSFIAVRALNSIYEELVHQTRETYHMFYSLAEKYQCRTNSIDVNIDRVLLLKELRSKGGLAVCKALLFRST